MIIFHSIRIQQFRAYEDVSVNFRADKGVILMYGDNGSGKSTLLNAINWCLYGDTPFYTTTKVEAILNKHAPEGATAQVVIIASIDSSKYRFCRKTTSDNAPSGTLEVSYESDGDWTVLDGTDGSDAVRRILPKDIRHLFFFNGERLKDIFTHNSEHDLKSSVRKVAELNIIDNAMMHLESASNTYLQKIRKISRNSQKIEQIQEKKDKRVAELNQCDRGLEDCMQNKRQFKSQIAELDKLIKDTARARECIKDRNSIEDRLAEIENALKTARLNRADIFQKNYHKLLLMQKTDEYKKALEDASDAGAIPPSINPKVTSEILKNRMCICGRSIGEQEGEFIEKQHAEYKNKDALRFLTDGILTFADMKNKYSEVRDNLLNAMQSIRENVDKKEELQKNLARINAELAEIDVNVNNLHDDPGARRIELENRISNLDISIGEARAKKEKIENELKEIDKDLKKNISEDDSTKELEQCLETSQRLSGEMSDIKLDMENAIRSKLQNSVWQVFSKILPDTNFQGIEIDENYDLLFVANDDKQYLTNTLSVGQTKALGLSLAYGLSKDLGYSGIPLLIDNLYGDLGETHFRDVTNMISSLASDKQVIVMDLNLNRTSTLFDPGIITQKFLIKRSAEDNRTLIEETNA